MLFNKVFKIWTPYGTVERTYHLYVESLKFFKQLLYKRTVFSYNICVVSSGIVEPISVKVHFVIKQLSVQRTECTESIGGEKHSACWVVSRHNFRPMYHVCGYKWYGMFSEAFCVAFFNSFNTVAYAETELIHKCFCFIRTYNRSVVIRIKHFLKRSAVIGFYMVYYNIIQRFILEDGFYIF